MPTITIDGKLIECASGKTIIEVATENGLMVPHFCWHPALSVSGNCRMCLVEVEKMPKLVIACSTQVVDGQVININNERVDKAREVIMEFLLINHPLDCPICDEAGQCKLQDYAFNHGTGESRFSEVKNHKDKRVSLGPEVLFDAERCITCSRCIRFSDEIAEQPALTFVNRGDKVTIETFPGTSLDNCYSMNVIDICPVGALTSKDFRFKSRVWDMSFNDTICPGCSKGCNIQAGVRDNEILRLEPRVNMKVNKYWMCDTGRLQEYDYVNNNRLLKYCVNKNETKFEEAITSAISQLRSVNKNDILFITSPFATIEENYLFVKLAKEQFGAKRVYYCEYNDKDFADNKLKTSDRTPNSNGAKICGAEIISAHQLADLIKLSVKAILTIDDHLFEFENKISEDSELSETLTQMDAIIVCGSNSRPITEFATTLIPQATYAEKEGTFVNVNGLVQHFEPVLVTESNLRIMGMKQSRLDKFGSYNDRWTQGEVRQVKSGFEILKAFANSSGAKWSYLSESEVFEEISTKIISLNFMDYKKLDEYMGINFHEGNSPKIHGPVYVAHDLRPQNNNH